MKRPEVVKFKVVKQPAGLIFQEALHGGGSIYIQRLQEARVVDWKAPGWEGRQGMVVKVTKATITVRFSDWSPTDVEFDIKDANKLQIVEMKR